MKLPYGFKDGKLVHISEVEKGKKCGCVCPACDSPLIARKGEKTIHHFAHDKKSICNNSVETALHIASKDILEKEKRIFFPSVKVFEGTFGENWIVSESMYVKFDEVKLEYRMDDLIPDVLIYVKGRPLLIEITVTHQTGKSKINKIKESRISCLEVDLSEINRNITPEELKDIIIHQVNFKKWLHNEKAYFYQKEAYSYAIKKHIYHRGLSKYDVVFCPIPTMGYIHNNRRYALVTTHCINCQFALPSVEFDDCVFCLGHSKIKNIYDLREKLRSIL